MLPDSKRTVSGRLSGGESGSGGGRRERVVEVVCANSATSLSSTSERATLET